MSALCLCLRTLTWRPVIKSVRCVVTDGKLWHVEGLSANDSAPKREDTDCENTYGPCRVEGDSESHCSRTRLFSSCARCPFASECPAFTSAAGWPVRGFHGRRNHSVGTETVMRPFCTALDSRSCWSCKACLGIDDFCPMCCALQPPIGTRSYFNIMDCDPLFDVDIPKLQQKYRNLQRSLHPDNFSQKSQERDFAEIQSALVNKAYRTLLRPLSRGLYLLKLHGIELKETDSELDSDYLCEILEINEKLAEAESVDEVYNIRNFLEAKIEELVEDIAEAFKKDNLKEATLLLTKMKYFCNLKGKVKEKLHPFWERN
ncbi:iron-sulfur cluster co-chaperone protein HscB isoform X2 [Protopterus annectens]|uniref:iron-sulfur cluster co-chaperone protein HscB isoform X2 n=1 Tax=Protopterus annectens TaxID=7888 RepID=UPI001CFBB83D|nr:iron-sulfur cluster co-chaperone protein HscB isoform X2 [Protopterus annectens]